MISMKAVVDRIENGCAVLLSDYPGVEIRVPLQELRRSCQKGDVLDLTIDDKSEEVSHGE